MGNKKNIMQFINNIQPCIINSIFLDKNVTIFGEIHNEKFNTTQNKILENIIENPDILILVEHSTLLHELKEDENELFQNIQNDGNLVGSEFIWYKSKNNDNFKNELKSVDNRLELGFLSGIELSLFRNKYSNYRNIKINIVKHFIFNDLKERIIEIFILYKNNELLLQNFINHKLIIERYTDLYQNNMNTLHHQLDILVKYINNKIEANKEEIIILYEKIIENITKISGFFFELNILKNIIDSTKKNIYIFCGLNHCFRIYDIFNKYNDNHNKLELFSEIEEEIIHLSNPYPII